MRVYFNTNIYCRPFDDLTQKRILNEATASLRLLLLASSKMIKIISSEMVLTEISLIESVAKKDAVELLVINNVSEWFKINPDINKLASGINAECNIKDYADCLHLAFGGLGNCEYFVTCDDELSQEASGIESFLRKNGFKIKIRNPVQLIKEMEV